MQYSLFAKLGKRANRRYSNIVRDTFSRGMAAFTRPISKALVIHYIYCTAPLNTLEVTAKKATKEVLLSYIYNISQ